MSQRRYKILLISGIAVSLSAILLFWFFYAPAKVLEADFLDVGQGDAVLIKAPAGQNILIDGGPDKTILKRLAENLPWYDRQIDLMILTHPHDDHVTGLIEVLKRYRVKKIIFTGVSHDAPNYLSWLETARRLKTPLLIIDKSKSVSLGNDARLEIIYPAKSFLGQTVPDLNQSSLVIKLVHGKNKFLFVGDAGEEVEKNLMAAGADLSASVLKVGHHGSQYSSGEEFLKKVSPEIAVIQVGKNNDFGHPSLRTIKKLERVGAEIYRADEKGTIKAISDGRNIVMSGR